MPRPRDQVPHKQSDAHILWFWGLVVGLILIRFALTADLSLLVIYAPHDDGLYVSRAFHLLSGNAFGPYDSRVLVKFPGISLWLAANRLLGIPYLFCINLLYILAGLYFVVAVRRCGFSLALLLFVFTLYLFNPVTLSYEWIRPLREPLSTSLFTLLAGAMIFILQGIQDRRTPFLHVVLFSAVFAFSLLVREEDTLLYAALFLFAIAVLWQAWTQDKLRPNATRIRMLLIIALPLLAANVANTAVRSYISEHYGLPIMHDYGEGEFPKLIAAMRSVESAKDNRLVMISQEALSKLQAEVPRLAPVINRLPQPSMDSFSCQLQGVCSEWANGWMPFWIKDAAFQAGLTPDLQTAQTFFRSARLDIEQACKEGRLKCRDKGSSLIPPFELRWTRAYVQELSALLGMTLVPEIQSPEKMPVGAPADVRYGRMYQVVTRTEGLDALPQTPQLTGQIAPLQYSNPLAGWREPIVEFYRSFGLVLGLAGMLAFLIRLRCWGKIPPGPFMYVAIVFTIYTAVRLAALSYVAAYLGRFDSRIIFSTYVVVILIAPLLIADAVNALSKNRPPHNRS